MMQSSEVVDLLRRAQAGDREALDRLLAALRPRLEHLARGYVEPGGVRESAADLVQEAALRIWQKLDQFRGTEDPEQTAAMFHEWVSQLVRHLARDRQRDRHAQRRQPPQPLVRLDAAAPDGSGAEQGRREPAASGPTPSANVRADEQARLLQAALARIPETADREILRLCFFEGLSLRQIAERLQVSYDKIRQSYHRGLRFLERELEGLL
jgi:RNA polymerase sigma-70 factor, ECF subfamily